MGTRRMVLMALVTGALLMGCGSSNGESGAISSELQADLMSRWNEVGANVRKNHRIENENIGLRCWR